jgi:hypothetical protein
MERLAKDAARDESISVLPPRNQQLVLLHIQCISTMCTDVQKQLLFQNMFFAHIQKQTLMTMTLMMMMLLMMRKTTTGQRRTFFMAG